MKWNDQLVSKLKELCNEGKPNKEIAEILRCDVKDVYAKRSQLRITIDKCKGMRPNPGFENILPQNNKKKMRKSVKTAFAALQSELLLAMASDWTGESDAKLYAGIAGMLIELEAIADKAFARG